MLCLVFGGLGVLFDFALVGVVGLVVVGFAGWFIVRWLVLVWVLVVVL